MSYFKILVGKDKFTLYDVTKDKHYIVEPEDLDHILDSDNPYNDDGTLNLRSYSDVINYYNRKNSKNKTSKAMTKGYISKKANIKKEYQAVSSSNRKDLLRRKLLAQNIDKSIIDKIVKYPTKDVANDLRVDDNTKRILTDIIEDVDTVAPLDDTEKNSINSKYVDESKLEDKRIATQDRNNLVLHAYNALQANQRTMLNSLRTIRDTIPDVPDYGNQLRNLIASFDALNNRVNNLPLPNIPDYAPQLLELNRRVQTLTDAVNNAPAAIDYRPQFTELNNRIREITNAIPAQIDYSRPLLELNNKMNALTDIVQNRPLPVEYKQDFENLNNRLIELNNNVTSNPNKDYTNDIKLLTDTIRENMKTITDGVDNLKNRQPIDYSADLKQIKDNTTSLINSIRTLGQPPVRQEIQEVKKTTLDDVMPNQHTVDNAENRQYDEDERNKINRNDNIERAVREQKPEVSDEWSKEILASPIDVLRHRVYANHYKTGPAHSLLKLLNNLNDLNETTQIKIVKFPEKSTNTDTYHLTTLGNTEDTGFEFKFDFGQNAPFKRIVTKLLDNNLNKQISSKDMLEEFVNTITREAKPSDLKDANLANAYMQVINKEGSPETMTKEQIEFVSKLPSDTTTITFDGTYNQINEHMEKVLDENYSWKKHPKHIKHDNDDMRKNNEFDDDDDDSTDSYDFVLEGKKKADNTYKPTNYNVYQVMEEKGPYKVEYSSMDDEGEGLAKILGRTINGRAEKSGNKFDLSAILSNSINNTY